MSELIQMRNRITELEANQKVLLGFINDVIIEDFSHLDEAKHYAAIALEKIRAQADLQSQ